MKRVDTLLNAATETGAGSLSHQIGAEQGLHAVQIQLGGDVNATAVTVDIEGSLDGSNFHQVDSHAMSAGELTAGGALYFLTDKPLRDIRANLTTLTGGTNPTVTVQVLSV